MPRAFRLRIPKRECIVHISARAFQGVSIYLKNLASIQPTTSLVKFARSPYTDPPGFFFRLKYSEEIYPSSPGWFWRRPERKRAKRAGRTIEFHTEISSKNGEGSRSGIWNGSHSQLLTVRSRRDLRRRLSDIRHIGKRLPICKKSYNHWWFWRNS